MYVVAENSPDQEFWSSVYQGRTIAVLNRGDRWYVYLDHVLQPKFVFATAGHARAWLINRIDQQHPQRLRRALAA
jgi:hypothetical protein